MTSGPGPIERRWSSRLHYRVFGTWPRDVVHERLMRAEFGFDPANVNAITRDIYAQAGVPVPARFR